MPSEVSEALNQICSPPMPPQRSEPWPTNLSGRFWKQSSSSVLLAGQIRYCCWRRAANRASDMPVSRWVAVGTRAHEGERKLIALIQRGVCRGSSAHVSSAMPRFLRPSEVHGTHSGTVSTAVARELQAGAQRCITIHTQRSPRNLDIGSRGPYSA